MKQWSKSGKRRALACGLLIVALAALVACSSQQASSSSSAKASFSAASDSPMLVVPNVVSLTQADAEKSIVAAGFKLGKVSHEASDTVPQGNVISQDPQALATDVKDKTVTIKVSSGKAAPKQVEVPDLKGDNQAAAEKELSAVGLIGIYAGSEESTEVEPGLIFKQSVNAGEKVAEGTKVSFTVALAPTTVKVPDVTGLTEKEAEAKIDDADLGYDTTSAYSSSVPEGTVMYQSYAAGTEVQHGTTIVITLSLGPKPADTVTVPNVITYSWSEAERALESAGLVARYTGDPSGIVVDQDIDVGTQVDQGTVVTVTLVQGDNTVTVPNLIGMTVSQAERVTDALGLMLDGANYGVIVDQRPQAGTKMEVDSTVSVDVEDQPGDSQVIVPDFVGMQPAEAESTAAALQISLDGEPDSEITDQSPDPGTVIEVGDTVSVSCN